MDRATGYTSAMEREEDESVASLMRSLGIDPPPDEEEDRPGKEVDEAVKRVLHGLGYGADSLSSPTLGPVLAQAGPKLKRFRERSGWTAPEISERTGVPLQVLEAFEAGEPVDEEVLLPALERAASACCCSIQELGLDRVDLNRPARRPRRRPAPLW